MDPLATETSEFWRNYGVHNDVDPAQDPDGSVSPADHVLRRGRRRAGQLRALAAMALERRGAARRGAFRSRDHGRVCSLACASSTQTEGGAFPDPIVNLSWPYANPHSPTPEELAKEYSGKALQDLADPKDPTKIVRKAGEQLAGFAELRDDGSTASGCWIFCGAWGPTGNLMARRDNSDPTGIGQTLNWAWAWPANRRVLYNRASCDPSGKPFNPRAQADRAGTARRGAAPTFRISSCDEDPANGMGPFIMNAEGVARFFARANMAEGPFPEHYEPFETPLGDNPLNPDQPRAISNPAARVFKDDRAAFGKAEQFPHVATTYRLTEHFHYWTKHVRLNAITQPEQFVEIGEALAKELGIVAGDRVKVTSNRGPHRGGGGRHQAHQAAQRRRQDRAHGRHPDPLGLHRRGQARLSRQHADAGRRRRQLADAGVQVVPGQGREGCEDDDAWHCNHSTSSGAPRPRRPRRACASRPPARSRS